MSEAPAPDDDDTVSVSTEPGDAVDPTVIVGDRDGTLLGDPDGTVLVDRDETVFVDHHDTVLVDREETVLVDRDETVVVERAVADADATRIVPRDANGVTVEVPRSDPTVRVERGASDSQTRRVDLAGSTPIRAFMDPPRRRRRGELRPAPVPSGFGGLPLVGSGAGAVSTYRVRHIALPVELAEPGPEPGPRRVVGGVESVARRSRRGALAAIGAAAASAVLLAGGVFWAVKLLVGF